jgi:hypothetical protein
MKRGGRVLVRLALLAVAAAACAALAQGVMVNHVAPTIGALLAQLPPAPAATESVAEAAADSASAPAPAPAPAAASAPAPAPAPSLLPRIVAARPIASASARPVGSMPHLSRGEIDDAIAHKLDGASAKLVRDGGGAPIGLAIQRPGRLARLGVATGDVLYTANGVRIRTPDEGLAALAQLEKSEHVVVTFHRGDASYAIVVDIAP